MKRISLIFCFCFLFSGISFASSAKSLIRLTDLSPTQIKALVAGDLDIGKVGKDFLEIVVSPAEKSRFTKKGYKSSVLIADLDEYISKILQSQKRGASYYTYETMTNAMKEWAQKYEKIAQMVSIGKSFEGRDIWAMKVSDNPLVDEKEPSCLIMGGNHAREWISVEVPMEALKQSLEGYGKDEKITALVNEREIWFVPMGNPDGVTYSQTKSKYWRKTRRNVDGRNFGVDMNRNYGWHWGLTGSSDNPSSDTYHGKKAFSEPENLAIKELADKEHFQASISFHSYSELILYPFGYAYNVPNDNTPILSKLAKEMSEFNRYTPENSADLYPAMGDSDDWLHGEHKTLAFTFELATTFIPQPDEIAGINQLNVPAVFHLIDKAGTYALTSPTGDKQIAASLDLTSALKAITDGQSVMNEFVGENQTQISDRLRLIGERAAKLVSDDLIKGNAESWGQVKSSPAAEFVKPIVRDQVMFEHVHGKSVQPQILTEMQNIR